MFKHRFSLVLKWSNRVVKLIQLVHALKILWDMVFNFRNRHAEEVEIQVPA